MARYIIRRLGFMALTMLLVSIAIFLISEVAPGDVARHILGQFATPEQ
ncbi:MAG: ABC transporter permease, partial [Chloroflexi bacterium]